MLPTLTSRYSCCSVFSFTGRPKNRGIYLKENKHHYIACSSHPLNPVMCHKNPDHKWTKNKFPVYLFSSGTRWRSWLRHCATCRKVAGSIPNVITEFRTLYGPGIHSACKRNEYQGYLPGPIRMIDNLTIFMCRMSRNSGSLRACPGLHREAYLFFQQDCSKIVVFNLRRPSEKLGLSSTKQKWDASFFLTDNSRLSCKQNIAHV